MAKDYFVAAQHRPRRVAFLVDVDQSPEELFNEIVDFNVSSWGGRYNPVIPVVDGTIPEPYWPLLQLIDADILYSYCDIATAGLRRIARDLQPLDVLRHNPESNSSRARINYQASALPVLTRVMQQFPTWARSPEPAVLTFDYKDTRSVSSFLRRNFGWSDQYFFWCRDHQIPNARMVPDDKDVMMALYSNRNLLMPIDICGVGPRKLRAYTDDHGVALTIFYGTSCWNFVDFWNYVHFVGEAPQTIKSISEMWITPSQFEDETFYQRFLELIRRRVSGSEHQNRISNYFQVVRMVFSSCVGEDGMETYPRNWRKMGLVIPKVNKRKQRRPCFTKEVMNHLANSLTVERKMRMLFILCGATGLRLGEALGIRLEKILDGGSRIIIDQKAWRGEIHDYLKTENGEREVDLPANVAKLLVEFIGYRKTGLLFCTRHGCQLDQRNILRHLHKALEDFGFEQAGAHSFRRYRNTYLRNFTACPESILDFWLGWSSEGMSAHYDKIKADVAFRKEVANSCGVGFDVPAILGSIEPIEPNLESDAVASSI